MLSPQALKTIASYFNLPFPGVSGVRCPYLNNARLKHRAELRALVGKGTPEEIVEEAAILSLRTHQGSFAGEPKRTPDDIRRFLIDHNLGIECSGFVTQVLRAHYFETKKIDLAKKMFIVSPRRFFRWLVSRFRPVENIGVRVYTNEHNSRVVVGHGEGVNAAKLQPGDIITALDIDLGTPKRHSHILLITNVAGAVVSYVHARAWSSDGRYGHGVAKGAITITDPKEPLKAQRWEELGKTNEDNETYTREIRPASRLEIRRLII